MKRYLLLAFLLVGCSTPSPVGVPNLVQVDPGVWRGGQPTVKGWKYLAMLGLTNDLKLNVEELVEERTNGFNLIYAPITTQQQLFGVPTAFPLKAAARVRPGTYVHCEHGQDRTGLIVAVYRVHFDGWTKQQAEQEMLSHGFHKVLHGLWEWWETWQPQ